MKRVISILVLLIVLFLLIEFIVTKFTSNHSTSYSIHVNDVTFDIEEKYVKKYDDTYSISITNDKYSFNYIVPNKYNKQKKIIDSIEYFKEGNNMCIYPVFKDKQETYILCSDGSTTYSRYTYPNQNFINEINNKLLEKKYITIKETLPEDKVSFTGSTIYKNNLNPDDSILLWKYKGIDILNVNKQYNYSTLNFDKYDNKVGYLVGKYYIIPNYENQKVLEFSSVTAINLDNNSKKDIDLDMILSSDTYVNGVIDGKLYYTDPSNLLQVEINPSNSNVRLIGDSSMGGQMYDGEWKDRNIYDFQSGEIKFRNKLDIGIAYKDVLDGTGSYYFYTEDGRLYQVLKEYPGKAILLYRTNGLNNFNVVDNDIYYANGSEVYNFNIMTGNKLVMINNDLVYNNANRIQVYRNK